jgi:hypothetical protein
VKKHGTEKHHLEPCHANLVEAKIKEVGKNSKEFIRGILYYESIRNAKAHYLAEL